MTKALLVFASVLAAVTLMATAAKAQSANSQGGAGNVESGKRVFVKYGCYTCHAYDGHGGGAGPKLAPKPLPSAAFIAIVRHPPPSAMPVFSAKIVSDAELNDILAYLKSMPESPAAKDIPLLNQK